MRKFLVLSLSIISMFSLTASTVTKLDHFNTGSLFITQIDLPETLLENIRSLNEEIKHAWPDSTYYRETIDFGKVFPALEEGHLIERPIPHFIAEIRNQLFEIFKNQINEDVTADAYDNCIITIYRSGNGIAPHLDRNFEWANKNENRKYYFGNSVIGLIVYPDTAQSLYFEHPKIGEESRFYLDEKPGTAFLFQDSLRNEWKHGLLPIAHERISITFRRVIQKNPE